MSVAPAGVRTARLARQRRYLVVVGGLAVVLLGACLLSLCVGDFDVPLWQVVKSVFGQGDHYSELVVRTYRLPRVVLALLTGASLAIAGAIFQALLHNELASPDVLGVTGGASVAAVIATLILQTSGIVISGSAILGAVIVAALIHVLAWNGSMAGTRFVLVGIGVAFMVTATLGYVLTRADIQQAQVALSWLVGGVGDAEWSGIRITAVAFAVLAVLTIATGPSLAALQLGDETARALGVPADRRRIALLALAVGFAAIGVAFAGPLAFVAFISAPIARRLLGHGSAALVPAALVGALLVVLADFGGQHLIPGGTILPAGVLTGAIGAPYLLWLLTLGSRTRGAVT